MMGGCVGCLHPDCIICYEEIRTNNHELLIRCKRCYAYSRNFDEIQHTRDCDNAQARKMSEVWSEHHVPEPERVLNIVPERDNSIMPVLRRQNRRGLLYIPETINE